MDIIIKKISDKDLNLLAYAQMELDSMSNNDYTDKADKDMTLYFKKKLSRKELEWWALRRLDAIGSGHVTDPEMEKKYG